MKAEGGAAVVLLATGLREGGLLHREARVGPPGEALPEPPAGATRAEQLTALLAACTAAIGGVPWPGEAAMRALTVGDRERLVVAILGAAAGGTVRGLVACPAGCGQRVELEAPLPLVPAPEVPAPATFTVAAAGWRVEARQATGADLEAAARLWAASPEGARAALLAACTVAAHAGDAPAALADAPPEVLAACSKALGEADPQAETTLGFACPACGAEGEAAFDAGLFLLAEGRRRAAEAMAEVHTLASRYHWSERDILAMPAARRRAYIDLIARGAA